LRWGFEVWVLLLRSSGLVDDVLRFAVVDTEVLGCRAPAVARPRPAPVLSAPVLELSGRSRHVCSVAVVPDSRYARTSLQAYW
jgi:hypothetical protein